MARKCKLCGAKLSQYNPGNICFPCQESRKTRLEEKTSNSLYYNLDDMCFLLGFTSPESVKRLSRKGIIPGKIPGIRKHLYLKERVDEWIQTPSKRAEAPLRSAEQGYKNPIEALQDEAYARCKKGDHSWFGDNRLNGLAYRCEPYYEAGYLGIEAKHFTKTCYFCGYSRSELIF